MNMEFCDKCGSRMARTKEGYVCPKCGIVVRAKPEMHLMKEKERTDSGSIYVSGESTTDQSKVSRQCPNCGNRLAFHWFLGVSGEHAGVRRERTIEHFKCTKCAYSWTEES
jgi:DNA-directed RNA polymerase subunit M/transcription elongation factor TFIIS